MSWIVKTTLSVKEQAIKVCNETRWLDIRKSFLGHIDFANSSYDRIVKDTERWKKEVTHHYWQKRIYLFSLMVRKIEVQQAIST